MVIDGNGLIAASFNGCNSEDAYVFARGVSNSATQAEGDYQRELSLLNDAIEKCLSSSSRLVYFSSGGAIYGETNSVRHENMRLEPTSRYGKHKLECENLIVTSGVDHLIARLPNVVGCGGNSSQLFPYLVNAVKRGKIIIFEKSMRDLIDVDDLSSIVIRLLRKTSNNMILNIVSGVSVSADELVKEINCHIKNNIDIERISGGANQVFSSDKLKALLPDLSFDARYPFDLVRKYIKDV